MFGRRKPEPDRSAAPDDESPDDDLAGHRPTGPIADESAHRLEHGIIEYSRWTLRLLIIGVGLFAAFWLMGQLWSVLLPIFFGLLLATILWPPVRFMRRKLPNALAAILALVGLLVIMGGLIAALAPQVTSQA
ncbi:MAG TPA: AI-2E family transporter, partial [Nakamurella sp.]